MKSKSELSAQFIKLLSDLMAGNVGETASIISVAQHGMRIFNDENINKEIQDIMFKPRTVSNQDSLNTKTSSKRIIGGKIMDLDSTVEQIEEVKKKIEPIKSGTPSKVAQAVDEVIDTKGKDKGYPSLDIINEILNQDTNQISEGLGIDNALKLVQLLGHKFDKQPTPLGVIKKLKELLSKYTMDREYNKIQIVNDYINSL